MALHPYRPVVTCGDEGGGVYLAELVGVEYGPIIVTPVGRRRRLGRRGTIHLRCPRCRQEHPLDEDRLGAVIDCPTSECELRLRVNPFVLTVA
jgi:hypothetical protein